MAEGSEGQGVLGNRFEAAFVYALHLHAQQKRKGTTVPYISHLLAVAALVLEDGGSEDEAIAALLHDAIEDQGGEPIRQEIRRRFGDKVVEIVNGCTDTDETPKPPWLERKKRYLEHLRGASPQILRVSAADKLHNARAVLSDLRRHGEAVWKRFNGGREGTLWYYRQLVQVFRATSAGFLVEELERVVAELERLADKTGPRP
ncbi:MAG TPA: HD domain-containing protein [Gemmataceae bacterium]|nr:HD domain-containing protein [Gemmataceae bacterium]